MKAQTTRAGIALTGTAGFVTSSVLVAFFATSARSEWAELQAGAAAAESVLLFGCAVTGLVLTARWAFGFALAMLCAVPGAVGLVAGQAFTRFAPAAVRRMMPAVVGSAVLLVAAGQSAQSSGRPGTAGVGWPATTALVPSITQHTRDSPVPTPPEPPEPPEPTQLSDLPEPGWTPHRAGPDPVVVTRGDTLWDLAADRLPPQSGPVLVDRAWRSWYAANRTRIGTNPGLIHPGLRLDPPTPRTADPTNEETR